MAIQSVQPSTKPSLGGDLSIAGVATLDRSIENWLSGVREVLRFTERLPMVTLVNVEDDLPRAKGPAEEADGADVHRRSHRFLVIRRFVLLYIESHLERQLKILGTALTVECLSVRRDEHSDRLRELLKSIEAFRSNRVRVRVRALLLRYTTPFILFVVGPATILDGGLNAQAARRALTLTVLLVSMPVYFLLFRPFTVRSGFVPKRALWSDGVTVQGFDSGGGHLMRRWTSFPTVDLHFREAQMFAALGVSPSPEKPLDISVGFDVAVVVVITGMFAACAALWLVDGPSVGLGFLIAFVVVMSAVWVKDIAANRRLRAVRLFHPTSSPSR